MTDLDQKCLPNGVPFDKDGHPRKRYIRVVYNDLPCVMSEVEGEQFRRDAMGNDDGSYSFEDVFLSDQEYEALPEFSGW